MAGTDHRRQRIEEGPAIILVHPQLGENIGMVARAMANFGLVDLRLVAPRDGWPNEKADAAASGALYVIQAARVFETLEEAVADLNYVVATTARQRGGFKRVLGPKEACQNLRNGLVSGQATGILFGREKAGLKNEEVSLADDIVTFPVNPAYASLNIAQAVLLMAYEYLQSGTVNVDDAIPFQGPDFEPASKTQLMGMFDQLEGALDSRGYYRTEEKRAVMVENLRAVLSRPGFTEHEIRLLRGVISSLDRFSPENPRGAGSPGDDPHRAKQQGEA